MDIADSLEHNAPGLLHKLQEAIRVKKFTARTESNYRHWIGRYVFFHDLKNPDKLDESNVREFLSYLATSLKVSPAKQNQALSALDFLYTQVLNKPLKGMRSAIRSKQQPALAMVSRYKKRKLRSSEEGDTVEA